MSAVHSNLSRRRSLRAAAAACLCLTVGAAHASPQLTVNPVTIELPAGQRAAAITLHSASDRETSFQVRVFAWNQEAGDDQLKPTDELALSPPLGVIPPGGTQVVRLVLRRPALGAEVSYRILLDQIPPPPEPGTIRVALRLSMPFFAEPTTRVAPHVHWRVERVGKDAYLVAINDGTRHEKYRDIVLSAPGGATFRPEPGKYPPYVLPGATRRWRLTGSTPPPASGTPLHLRAESDGGKIDQTISVAENP